jgi:penicillin-binding protein 1A
VDNFINHNQKKMLKSQLAVIVMSKDGAIRAMIGGKDYQKSPYNRAVYSKRQPGSAFKTFVYLTAFQNGFKPDDQIDDKKISIGNWSPENYDKKYLGLVSLKTSFASSSNSAAVQLAANLNSKDIVRNAEKLGITSAIDKNDPTITLGTMQVSLLELVSSYATIANDGYPVFSYAIESIKNEDDNLYERETSGLARVIDPEQLTMLKEILREVVQKGTGKNANIADNIYGKTGTSQNSRDAWFIGFDDDYVIGVWIGNDDNSPTDQISGGSLPAFLFADIMRKIS